MNFAHNAGAKHGFLTQKHRDREGIPPDISVFRFIVIYGRIAHAGAFKLVYQRERPRQAEEKLRVRFCFQARCQTRNTGWGTVDFSVATTSKRTQS